MIKKDSVVTMMVRFLKCVSMQKLIFVSNTRSSIFVCVSNRYRQPKMDYTVKDDFAKNDDDNSDMFGGILTMGLLRHCDCAAHGLCMNLVMLPCVSFGVR